MLDADNNPINKTLLSLVTELHLLAPFMRRPTLKTMTLALGAFLILGSFFLWVKVISPRVQEGTSAWSALNSEFTAEGPSEWRKRPHLTLVKTLDPSLLPRPTRKKTGSVHKKRRLIFIGDIHGCLKELEALLNKVHFHAGKDHLIALGDIVSKGPDSLGVVDLLRRYNASCVRGNHDDALILVAERLRSKSTDKSGELTSAKETDPAAESHDPVKRMARSLSVEQLEYLQSCPIILRIGELKAFNGEAVAVHAGLIPGLSVESQDPVSAMNLRVIDLKTHVPSHLHKLKGSIAWYKLWNRYQQLLDLHKRFGRHNGRESEKHTTVIYGHNAREGLQIRKYTKGLDTGCVRGGKLTALVVDGNGRQEVVQVKAMHHGHKSALQVDVLRDGWPEASSSEAG